MKRQTQWSRRKFLSSVAGAGPVLLLNPLASWATDQVNSDRVNPDRVNPDRVTPDRVTPDRVDPRVAAIVAATIGIDTHNHIDVPITTTEVPGPAIDLVGEMKKSGLSAICMTFAVDYQPIRQPGEGYDRFINGLTSMDRQLSQNGIKRSLNLADIQSAHKKHQPTVIQSVEGGHFLEGRIERLGEAYSRGLRQLGLLHDNDASVPLGDIYTKSPQWGGLTAFGSDVIRECNRLGILVDLTHASNETVNAALKVAAKPVVITHTGLDSQVGNNPVMAKMMRPRLISKEQAKIVADAGGVLGVWTHLTDTPLAYAQHVRALVDVIGIDHVCIGTDTKLTPAYRPGGNAGPKPGGPSPQPGGNPINQQGGPPGGSTVQNGPGGGQNRGRVGERTNEAWQDQQVGFYYAVVEALLTVGFSEKEIGKVGGGNFCRVFDAATAGHH